MERLSQNMRKPETFKIFFYFYLPLILWLGVIFAFSSMSGYAASRELTVGEWIVRKGAHVSEFFILGILTFRLVWRYFQTNPCIAFFLAGSLALFFAALDELHQYFVPLRQARVTDIAIDAIGIGLALGIFFIMRKISEKNNL